VCTHEDGAGPRPLAKTGSPPAERNCAACSRASPHQSQSSLLPSGVGRQAASSRSAISGGREFRGRDRRLATVRRLLLPAPHNPIRPSSLAAPPRSTTPLRAPRDIPASASNRSSASHHFIKQTDALGIRSVDGRHNLEARRPGRSPHAILEYRSPALPAALPAGPSRRPDPASPGGLPLAARKYRRLRAGPSSAKPRIDGQGSACCASSPRCYRPQPECEVDSIIGGGMRQKFRQSVRRLDPLKHYVRPIEAITSEHPKYEFQNTSVAAPRSAFNTMRTPRSDAAGCR